MNGSTEYDESSVEDYEAINGEYDEAAPRRGYRPQQPLKQAKGGGLVPPKPTGDVVTEARLQAALARVGSQIKTNAEATETVTKRVNSAGLRLDDDVHIRPDVPDTGVSIRSDLRWT